MPLAQDRVVPIAPDVDLSVRLLLGESVAIQIGQLFGIESEQDGARLGLDRPEVATEHRLTSRALGFLQRKLRDLFGAVREVVAPVALVGQKLEQFLIGVVADGDAGERGPITNHVVDQPLIAFPAAGAGLAVREQHDVTDIGIDVANRIEPDREGRVNLGPPIGRNARYGRVDVRPVGLALDRHHGECPLLRVAEHQDSDLVADGKRLGRLTDRLLGHVDLASAPKRVVAHRAGLVHD